MHNIKLSIDEINVICIILEEQKENNGDIAYSYATNDIGTTMSISKIIYNINKQVT